MTKAVIEMHGPVIIWLCNNPGKGVWRNNTEGGGWKIQHDPKFWLNYKYVQDDEYAELRMAQIDGKIIQWDENFEKSYPNYADIKDPIDDYVIEVLRIKPDKPEFKVGVWVVYKDKLYTVPEYQISPNLTIESKSQGTVTFAGDSRQVKLWEPKEGEMICYKTLEGFYMVKPYSPYMKRFEGLAPKAFIQTLEDENEK